MREEDLVVRVSLTLAGGLSAPVDGRGPHWSDRRHLGSCATSLLADGGHPARCARGLARPRASRARRRWGCCEGDWQGGRAHSSHS